MLNALHAILQFDRATQIIDIGANPIDGDPPYKELLRHGLCKVTGFEPQEDALAQLRKDKSQNENYLPYAVGNGSPNSGKGTGVDFLFTERHRFLN